MKKIGGWTRIGVVLSIIWSILILGYASTEHFALSTEKKEIMEDRSEFSVLARVPSTNAVFFKWLPIDFLDKESSPRERNFQLKKGLFIKVLFIPIIIMWGFTIITVKTFLWVKKGFVSDNGS